MAPAAPQAPIVAVERERRIGGWYSAAGMSTLSDRYFSSMSIAGMATLDRVTSQGHIGASGSFGGTDLEAGSLAVSGRMGLNRAKIVGSISGFGGLSAIDLEADSLNRSVRTDLTRARIAGLSRLCRHLD